MLISGKSYNLETIFSQDNIIMIPDMQREYCWAKTFSNLNNKSLVYNFTVDLISNAANKETIQMGLLYAYESPRNQIQLCDGQQRITTLFLLLGYLYHKTESISLKAEIEKALVLPGNNNGIKECRLRYAIRESTLFFTRDLTEKIFLNSWNKNDEIKSFIKSQDWYFNEYELDPSIQNMLEALSVFQALDNDLKDEVSVHILRNIDFLFFDMENRTYGEEQFVVLNTTGKPLTITENIKPKILAELDASKPFKNGKTALRYYADLWEEWEYYFWENKNELHRTSDKGLNEFFRWIYIIESSNSNNKLGSDPESYTFSQKALVENSYDILELRDENLKILELINKYFNALRELENDDEIKQRFLFQSKSLSQIQIFEFLPLLAYLKNFNSKLNCKGYIRLKNFLNARAKDNNVAKSSSTTAIRSIQIVLQLVRADDTDIANYKLYEDEASETILSNVERYKFDVFRSAISRDEVEKNFWEAERLKACGGNIEFIFNAINLNEERNYQNFELDNFIRMKKVVELTFNDPKDLLRRSLLTFDHYYKWHGSTPTLSANRYTLGEEASFFGDLANENSEKSKALLNFLNAIYSDVKTVTSASLQDYMDNRINKFIFKDTSIWERTRATLINDESYLGKMQKKLFCVSERDNKAYLLKRTKVSTDNAFEELKFEDAELTISN